MISFEEFCQQTNGPKDRKNYEAMLRLAKRFDIEFNSYQEFKEKCLASFEIAGERLERGEKI